LSKSFSDQNIYFYYAVKFILCKFFLKHYDAKRIFMIFLCHAFTFWTFYKCPKNISTY